MQQYQFDPHVVELAFGIEERPLPAWEIDLGSGHRLSFRGKIDRVDLCRRGPGEEALCVVVDYKSSARRLDPVLLAHGIQLQLPAYLNVLRALKDPERIFGVKRLVPAGVFFVNLRGRYESASTRNEALSGIAEARARAYQHTGRFDVNVLSELDSRPEVLSGDQFNYRLKKNREIYASCREALQTEKFNEMLDQVEEHLKRMGGEIFSGCARTDPYRKGSGTACDKCQYQCVCRIDPWTHSFRVLEEANTAGG
jgi:ATP-dependent helicase/nuclease subunit B